MKYSLIHPSRWRSSMAFQAFTEWMSKASDQNEYEYLLSIDSDDTQLENYKTLFEKTGVKLIINNNRSLVDAVNIAATYATGYVLIVVSDDFGCPENWDIKIKDELYAKSLETKLPIVYKKDDHEIKDITAWNFAVLIDDCLNPKGTKCMTLPILSKSIYQKLRHIYNPIYFSLFADQELYDVCEKNGWLIHSDLKFPHSHWLNGKNPKDATYQRENSSEAYMAGKKIYEARKLKNFQT